MCLFSDRSHKMSKCSKNKKVSLMFLPHFDICCDILLNRCTATWIMNLFVFILARVAWSIRPASASINNHLNSSPINEVPMKAGGGAQQNASLKQGAQVSMATQRAATTTRHSHTENSVEILTNHYTHLDQQEGGKREGQTAAQRHDL